MGSNDKKRLHHPVDSTPKNKNINDYMDDVCNFVMEKIEGLPEISPLIISIIARKIARNRNFTEMEIMVISLLYQ